MFRTSFAFRLLMVVTASAIAFPAFLSAQSGAARQTPPAQTTTPIYTAPGPLLPNMFAGWQLAGTPQTSTNPETADRATADALKEYGFSRYEAATYARGSDTLTLKAVQFQDATGAYGAFTFYRRPNMATEQIGQGAAFDGNKVLLWKGIVFVEATFSRVTATSAGELRDLCTLLPKPQGNQGTMPTLPDYLPQGHLMPETIVYAIGPDAYAASGGVLPPSLVGFDMSAEAVTAQYESLNGTGVLTIIDYPTPQIAAARQGAIAEYLKTHGSQAETKGAGAMPAWTTALANSYPEALQTRRSGPLVAITSGEFTAGTAQQMLQRVNYEAAITLGNSGHYVPDTTKLAQLILSVAYLVGIFALIAIVAAISLGGGKVWLRKIRRKSGQPEDDSAEFIRLNLRT